MKEFRNKIQILKRKKYFRLIKYSLLAFLSVAFLDKCTYMVMPPWKEIEPTKPDFKAEDFEYEDYVSWKSNLEENLEPVLLEMFPIGTSKKYVDEILVDQGGAKIEYSSFHDYYVYSYWAHKTVLTPVKYFQPFSSIIVIYNSNSELQNIKSYNNYLYGEPQ
tara:strand:+ start:67 stop:552 length:486 start_codon:yes stop_codon:yes gene_type:complete